MDCRLMRIERAVKHEPRRRYKTRHPLSMMKGRESAAFCLPATACRLNGDETAPGV